MANETEMRISIEIDGNDSGAPGPPPEPSFGTPAPPVPLADLTGRTWHRRKPPAPVVPRYSPQPSPEKPSVFDQKRPDNGGTTVRLLLATLLPAVLPKVFAQIGQQKAVWDTVGERVGESFRKKIEQTAEKLEAERQELRDELKKRPEERQKDFIKGLDERKWALLRRRRKVTARDVEKGIPNVVNPAGTRGGAGSRLGAMLARNAPKITKIGIVAGVVVTGLTALGKALSGAATKITNTFAKVADSDAGKLNPKIILAQQELRLQRFQRDFQNSRRFGDQAANALRVKQREDFSKEELALELAEFGRKMGLQEIKSFTTWMREQTTGFIKGAGSIVDTVAEFRDATLESIEGIKLYLGIENEKSLAAAKRLAEAEEKLQAAQERQRQQEKMREMKATYGKFLDGLFGMQMPGEDFGGGDRLEAAQADDAIARLAGLPEDDSLGDAIGRRGF